MSNKVVLDKVNKSYTKGKLKVPVLKDLSLTIDQGEFVAIMGPSGTGKSTLLNIISGLDKIDSGIINVFGEDISKLSKGKLADWRAKHLGFVFQSYHLIQVLNATQNVELPLLLGKDNSQLRQRKVNAALQLVNLGDKAKNLPSELSGGQEQRVAIARAIVADPDILICDEPTGGLDKENSIEILELLKVLNEEQGKTIIMVTHDQSAAEYASRTLMLTPQQDVQTESVDAS